MLKKLVLVYNPQASHHLAVEREVLSAVRKLSGWLVGKYEVSAGGIDENVQRLSEILNDGDLVIVAGGDGTATMAVNGIMRSGKKVTLGVLGYGNFNDMARMLKTKQAVEYGDEYIGGIWEILQRFEEGKTREIYPLEVKVNGEHWRYAPCYFSMGMMAESTMVFEEPEVRKKLKSGKKKLWFSVWTLAKWYFKNRKRKFLASGKVVPEGESLSGPEIIIQGVDEPEKGQSEGVREISGATDYIAVNSPRVARMMKGGRYYKKTGEFWSGVANLGGIWQLGWFMVRSILVKMPGKRTVKDVIKFDEPSEVVVQTEGEFSKLKEVETVEVLKGKVIRVV